MDKITEIVKRIEDSYRRKYFSMDSPFLDDNLPFSQ